MKRNFSTFISLVVLILLSITLVFLITEHPMVFATGVCVGWLSAIIVIPAYIIFKIGKGLEPSDYDMEELVSEE